MTILARLGACLILVLGLSFPSFAKSPDTCASNANQIMKFVQIKEAGITKKELMEALDFDAIPEEYRRQVKKDITDEINKVYDSKGESALELASDYFYRCLEQPNYKPETEI